MLRPQPIYLESKALHVRPITLGLNKPFRWFSSRLMIPNRGMPTALTWRCYQTKLGSACPRAVKPIYWHWVLVKESAAFTEGHQARRPGQLVLKRPKFPEGFQGKVFKDRVREGGLGVCDPLMDILLIGWWWGNQESRSSNFGFQPVWGLRACEQQTVNRFHLAGVSVSCDRKTAWCWMCHQMKLDICHHKTDVDSC